MKKEFTEHEIRELEKQLSCPSGQSASEIEKNLYETNIGMILNSIEFLEIEDYNFVLELGHGNCEHLKKLLEAAKGIKYFGLEISEAMWKEAKKASSYTDSEFLLYDGEKIQYEDLFFDRIMSVNTIYFWQNPEKLINEIDRTLKPGGRCVLSYVDKKLMKKLPFVGQRFKLYDKNEIEKLVGMSNLKVVDFRYKTEQVKTKTGEQVERNYTMAKMAKL